MIVPAHTKKALDRVGEELKRLLPEFYGKVTFNFYNGEYVCINVEQTIKKDNLNKRSQK